MVLSAWIAATSCGAEPVEVEPIPTVSGTWDGVLEGQPLSFVLTEAAGGAVSGDARLELGGPLADAHFRVTGLHDHPDLDLQLESSCAFCPASPPWRFEGAVAEDRLQGVLIRDGAPDQPLILTRR